MILDKSFELFYALVRRRTRNKTNVYITVGGVNVVNDCSGASKKVLKPARPRGTLMNLNDFFGQKKKTA